MKKITVFFLLTFFLAGFGKSIFAQDVVDATTMNNKIMAGYQGWFGAPGDGSGYSWIHWGGPTINADNISFDMWPDMREYDADELFATEFVYSDLSNAGLFSSYTKKTVNRHVKWMKDYGIDGVFVQRFISSALSRRAQRDTVLQNVRYGAEEHGRVFANMYDMSGGKAETFVNDVKNDWIHLVDDLKITESPNYLHHDGLPVLSLWGVNVGGSRDIITAAIWSELLQWFTVDAPAKYQVCLKAGVGNGWRGDGQEWQDVYNKFEFLSPWAVGRYNSNSGNDNYRNQYFAADLSETHSRGMDYIPVVFPGFSWANLYEGKELNQIPRNGGRFLWHQFYNAIDAGCNMVYVAMFDEVDEGTAIFKTTENASQNPTTGRFVTLDADGEKIPSDWYLRLTGEASKMLRGEIPVTSTIPIVAYPDNSEFVDQDVPTIVAPSANVSVSISMKNSGTTSWTKADGYKLGSKVSPDDNIWGINRIELDDAETIAPGASKTFTFDVSVPASEGVYEFQWQMIKEGEDWIGEAADMRLINVETSVLFLDDCDAASGWTSSSSVTLNSTDQVQGSGCVEFAGGVGDDSEFEKVFTSPYNADLQVYDAVLQFWYYVSDVSLVGNSLEIGLGSAGEAGKDVNKWTVKGITSGWNLISLRVSDAIVMGSPDINAINWFSLQNTKTGSVITRIDEIQLFDRNSGSTKFILKVNDGSGDGQYIVDAIVTISADQAAAGQEFSGWTVVSGDPLFEDEKSMNTSIRMSESDVEISAEFKTLGKYFDDCDQLTGWGTSGGLTLNEVDQQEGAACIEFSGDAVDEYKKALTTPYVSGASAETGQLEFWYYVSDASLMGATNQVEIGSGGRPDQDEYSWTLSGLQDGWNLVSLPIVNAGVIGTPDLNALNWFRIYNFKSGSVVTRIDAIDVNDESAGDRYTLTVSYGSGDGSYYAGLEIPISADAPAAGMLFDKWVLESGSAVISDVYAESTTVTTSSDASVVVATYRSVQDYSLTVNNGSGSGDYKAGVTIVIQAKADYDGMEFDKWIVESGNVEVSNPYARFTYLTMPEEDVVITAAFLSNDIDLSSIDSEFAFKLYPNPTNTECNIDFTLTKSSEVYVSMYDISGREHSIFIGGDMMMAGSHTVELPLAGIHEGIYLVKIRINDNLITKKLVVR